MVKFKIYKYIKYHKYQTLIINKKKTYFQRSRNLSWDQFVFENTKKASQKESI